MTHRIYESDAFLFETDAHIVSRHSVASGEMGAAEAVVLDRTVFYATSGGQPHDTGYISGVRVLRVENDGDNVVHYLEKPLPDGAVPGTLVRLAVDTARRTDFMQQHHGQHLLSAAIFRTTGANTVAVHFGAESSTLDLDRLVNDGQAAQSFEVANRIVMEDREVRIHNVPREELHRFELRREPGIDAPMLRLIEVEGFDTTPCSGTHPDRTGRVGPIAQVGAERMRGGTRLVFLCGWRAIRDHSTKHGILQLLAKNLAAPIDGLGGAVERLSQSERELRRRQKSVERALAALEARAAAAVAANGIVTLEVDGDRGEEYLATLSAQIVQSGCAAVLGLRSGGRAALVTAAPKGSRFDCRVALEVALSAIDGKGGGNMHFARGSGSRVEGLRAALDAATVSLAGT